MHLVEAVHHALLRIVSHARGTALMYILSKQAQFFRRRLHFFDFDSGQDLAQPGVHRPRHGGLVLSVTGADVQHGNSPRVGLAGVQLHVILVTRQALSLRVDAEAIWYLPAHLPAQRTAKSAQAESVSIEFLLAVAGQIVTAQEILIAEARIGIHVFRHDITGGTSDRFAPRGPQSGQQAAAILQGEMVHQVMAQRARGCAHALRKSRRARVQQNARDSNALAANTTVRPWASRSARVCRSTNTTPVALPRSSMARWLTMASLTSVNRPVRAASGSVTDGLLKYEAV